MLTKVPRGWEIPEREATPESVFHNRREILRGMGFIGVSALLAQAAGSGDRRRSLPGETQFAL